MADKKYTDAIALLKADHREVEELFEKFKSAKGLMKKQALAEKICTELKIHSMIEEELFYPAFDGKIKAETLTEAYVEHDGAKVLINDIMTGSPDDEFYDAKVKVLSEEIEHHVKEENTTSRKKKQIPKACSRSVARPMSTWSRSANRFLFGNLN